MCIARPHTHTHAKGHEKPSTPTTGKRTECRLWGDKLQKERLTGVHSSHTQSPPLLHPRPQGNKIEEMRSCRHPGSGHDDLWYYSAVTAGPATGTSQAGLECPQHSEAGSPTSPAHSTPAAGELAAVKSGRLDRALMEVAPSGGGGRRGAGQNSGFLEVGLRAGILSSLNEDRAEGLDPASPERG